MSEKKEKRKASPCFHLVILAIFNILVDVLVVLLNPEIIFPVAGVTIGVSTLIAIGLVGYCAYCVEAQAKAEMEASDRLRGPDTTPGGHRKLTCTECGGVGYYEFDESNIVESVVCRYCGKAFELE